MLVLQTAIYFASSLVCALLALHLLSSTALKPAAARWLGANFLLYSFNSAFGCLALLSLNSNWNPFFILRATSAMLLGPALYFYYLVVLKQERMIRVADWLHGVPAIAVLLLLVFPSGLSRLVDFLIPGSFACYLFMIIQVLRERASAVSGQHSSRRWFQILAAMMAVALTIELMVAAELALFGISRRVISVLIGSTAFLIFVCTTLMLALKRSSLLEWMTELGNDLISSKPELDDDNLKEIFLRFQQRVVDENWHIQQSSPSLSLAARKLGVPMRHLSEAINRCYRGSYSRYLNDQRIATAQRLMREEPERLITDIMFAAGFASKSNFNKEFQRVTGLSPSIWREKSRESVSG